MSRPVTRSMRSRTDSGGGAAGGGCAKRARLLSVPDAGGRYYVIALFDMWSNVFASIGARTTGTTAQNVMIAGPRWQGTSPAGITQAYRSPTRFVWVNGQMLANGPADYEIVNALQKQYKLTPLSAWGQPWAPLRHSSIDFWTRRTIESPSTRCSDSSRCWTVTSNSSSAPRVPSQAHGWISIAPDQNRRSGVFPKELGVSVGAGAQGLLHHSDRGSQYASGDYRQLLAQHGIVGSGRLTAAL